MPDEFARLPQYGATTGPKATAEAVRSDRPVGDPPKLPKLPPDKGK